MTSNIPLISAEALPLPIGLLKPKPLRPDQIAWPKNQRKDRKNRRRAFATGNKRAFK